MKRFEPHFHGFVAADPRYKSVKTRFKTEHFSLFYGHILILAFGQIFIFFYKSYFLRIFFLVVGTYNIFFKNASRDTTKTWPEMDQLRTVSDEFRTV